ncbi:MAG: hypothetical protein FJ225_03865 [Lentisphaerae bacterium]|nr:hypothetical protein [Lentisphaerota bacterium]
MHMKVRAKKSVGRGAAARLRPRLALLAALLARVAAAEDWSVHGEKHFIIHYAGADGFAREVGRRAEQYYDTITRDLGISRRADFWLWNDRVRLYIYPTRAEFVAAAAAPAWAGAKTDYDAREVRTFQDSPSFLDTLLPHELAHLVFRDFVGTGGHIPLWLDEGVAQWEERSGREEAESRARLLLRQGRLLPLERLMLADVREGAGGGEAEAFYAQARSIVAYLIEEHGPERFRRLCGQLREGKTFEQALRFTYGDRIDSMAALESQWRKYVEESQ